MLLSAGLRELAYCLGTLVEQRSQLCEAHRQEEARAWGCQGWQTCRWHQFPCPSSTCSNNLCSSTDNPPPSLVSLLGSAACFADCRLPRHFSEAALPNLVQCHADIPGLFRAAGPQSQIVCCDCRTLLMYPQVLPLTGTPEPCTVWLRA